MVFLLFEAIFNWIFFRGCVLFRPIDSILMIICAEKEGFFHSELQKTSALV